jgi:tellurite resistance protein
MSKESRDYLEMSFRSIRAFGDDGRFSPANLQEIVDIALRDGVVDANEQRVLAGIIGRLKPEELTAEMKRKLDELKQKLG